MKFEWDDKKASDNHAKHRVQFLYATRVFLDPRCIVVEDARQDYGETRYNAMGYIERRFYVVTFTMRGISYRLISARKGNKREQKAYHQVYAGS